MRRTPSSGDPVEVTWAACALYSAALLGQDPTQTCAPSLLRPPAAGEAAARLAAAAADPFRAPALRHLGISAHGPCRSDPAAVYSSLRDADLLALASAALCARPSLIFHFSAWAKPNLGANAERLAATVSAVELLPDALRDRLRLEVPGADDGLFRSVPVPDSAFDYFEQLRKEALAE